MSARMNWFRAGLWAALVVAGCGYEPPAEVDRSKPSYHADLDACEDSAAKDVSKQNAKTLRTWVTSPVRRWGQLDRATTSCMAGKGYGQVRWCTEDELRGARRTGNVVVTASGLQCTEPPAPERRRAG